MVTSKIGIILPRMNKKINPSHVVAALLVTAFAAPSIVRAVEEPELLPQNHTDWFPFVIPTLANERTQNTAIDLSFLNREAAGASGFLHARGETIVDGRGREVRLFGTNITDYHVMPPKDKAPLIARRLRELGVNFIRLHYYDWDKAPRVGQSAARGTKRRAWDKAPRVGQSAARGTKRRAWDKAPRVGQSAARGTKRRAV